MLYATATNILLRKLERVVLSKYSMDSNIYSY